MSNASVQPPAPGDELENTTPLCGAGALDANVRKSIELLVGDGLTADKAAFICRRDEFKVTGVVLSRPDGYRCIVELSAVRWLDKLQMWKLMHPDS